MNATKTRRRQIATKPEQALAATIDFKGKYVDSLLESAAARLKIEDGLPDAQSYLREIKRRRAEGIKAKWGMSVAKYERLQRKASAILRAFSTGYSMGDSKRLLIDGKAFREDSTCQSYARSCAWEPTHGSVVIVLTLRQLQDIELVEGVWTLRGKDNKAKWLQASGGKGTYSVRLVSGFLIGRSHGTTIEECEALERGKAVRVEGGVKYLTRFVGLGDRRAAGACEPGVLAFCERHGLDPTMGYRLDYLMGLNDATARPYLEALARRLSR